MVIETTHANTLSALVVILSSPVLSSTHCIPAFIPITPLQLLLSESHHSVFAKVSGLWPSHRIRQQEHSTHVTVPSWTNTFFSFLPWHHTLLGFASLPQLTDSCFSVAFAGSSSSQGRYTPGTGLHIFSLVTLSLVSKSVPVTLNTVYMWMTLNFLSPALNPPLDSKLLHTTTYPDIWLAYQQ